MDKQITIQDKDLFFGRAGIYEHIKDSSGEDPLIWLSNTLELFKKDENGQWKAILPMDQFSVIAYAGINLNADINDLDAVPFDRVKRWVRTLTIDECWQIMNEAISSMIIKESNHVGESQNQPVS